MLKTLLVCDKCGMEYPAEDKGRLLPIRTVTIAQCWTEGGYFDEASEAGDTIDLHWCDKCCLAVGIPLPVVKKSKKKENKK